MKTLSGKVRRLEESATLAFTARARDLRASGVDVVSLTAGEPDFPTPLHVKMAAIRAIEENFTHYTANQGIPELVRAIREKFERDNNLRFDPSQILVSCGAKHSIYNTLQAICNPGDEVVVAAPYWVTYPEIVKLVDAIPVIVSSGPEEHYKLTAKKLRRAINAKTKAFIFNSPSNPTGSVYSQGEIEELADVVKKTGIYVVADEIYEKIVYDGAKHFSIGSIREIRDHVVTINGFSKAYAMTGWRLGYLGAPRDIADAAAKVQSQVTSNATSITQKAAVAALCGPQDDVAAMVKEFQRRRDFVVERFTRIPEVASPLKGEGFRTPRGAFYLFPSLAGLTGKRVDGKLMRDDTDLCFHFLNNHHLAMVPGSAFGAKNCVRMSYACSMKELESGLTRFEAGIKALRSAC